jgi:tRNA pseudouridine38-40 synthase
MTTRYRAILAYDGTAYQGFQRQLDAPTIQGQVEAALEAVTRQRVTVIGAGRTDTGVHATGQVIAFEVEWRHEPAALLNAVNANLPDDIAVQDIALAAAGFHPRFDARARTYRYTIITAPQRQPLLRQRAWWLRGELDGAALQHASALLIGEHDFATFGKPPQGNNTVRTVMQSGWQQSGQSGQNETFGQRWIYTIQANAFLQHMVRRVVGLLVQVGRGAMSHAEFEVLFRRAELASGIPLAPPQGLALERVDYE